MNLSTSRQYVCELPRDILSKIALFTVTLMLGIA